MEVAKRNLTRCDKWISSKTLANKKVVSRETIGGCAGAMVSKQPDKLLDSIAFTKCFGLDLVMWRWVTMKATESLKLPTDGPTRKVISSSCVAP